MSGIFLNSINHKSRFDPKSFDPKSFTSFDIALASVFFIGLYTGVFFYFSSTLFLPFGICGVCAPIMVWRRKSSFTLYKAMPLISIYAITFIGILFAPGFEFYLSEYMKGLVQLVYSSMVGLIMLLYFVKWEPKNISKLFYAFILIVLIGTLIENYVPPFKAVSDSFRSTIFHSGVYENDIRDVYLYSNVRPKLFTSEPSHVAKFYLLSLFAWFSLSTNKRRYLELLLFTIAGYLSIRSPIIILIIPLIIIIEMFYNDKVNINSIFRKDRPLIQKSLLFALIISLLLMFLSFSFLLKIRINKTLKGEDESFSIRIAGPALIAAETIKKYPLWGAGVTGKESIADIIEKIYSKLNVIYYSLYSFASNAFFMFFIYYGIVGSCLVLFCMRVLLKRLGITRLCFVILSIIVFGQIMGAFVGPRVWCYAFIVLLIAKFKSKETNKRNRMQVV